MVIVKEKAVEYHIRTTRVQVPIVPVRVPCLSPFVDDVRVKAEAEVCFCGHLPAETRIEPGVKHERLGIFELQIQSRQVIDKERHVLLAGQQAERLHRVGYKREAEAPLGNADVRDHITRLVIIAYLLVDRRRLLGHHGLGILGTSFSPHITADREIAAPANEAVA